MRRTALVAMRVRATSVARRLRPPPADNGRCPSFDAAPMDKRRYQSASGKDTAGMPAASG